MLIDIVVYDELDALGPLEVLRNAGKAGADVVARLVTRRPQEVVLGSNGLRFLPAAVYQPRAAGRPAGRRWRLGRASRHRSVG
jgi:hypothetical protein